MRTHILTFPWWDEISIAVEQPSASHWQQEQERERKKCGLVIVECGLSLRRGRISYAKWTESLSEWCFSEYYYFSVCICLYNTSFVQNAGICKTLLAPCTQHTLYWTAEDNKKLLTNRQMKPLETTNKTSGSVTQEWANCMLLDDNVDCDYVCL